MATPKNTLLVYFTMPPTGGEILVHKQRAYPRNHAADYKHTAQQPMKSGPFNADAGHKLEGSNNHK